MLLCALATISNFDVQVHSVMGADYSQFNVGDILRFGIVPPFHYAVYIGEGQIVHYNAEGISGLRADGLLIQIIRETIEEYKNR